MEPPPPAAVGYQTANGAKRLWPGSTSYRDPDIVEVASSALGSSVSNKQNHKGSQFPGRGSDVKEAVLKIRLPLDSDQEPDQLIWAPSKDGHLSTKSAYKFLSDRASKPGPSHPHTIWKLLWLPRNLIAIPPRVSNFIWKVLSGALPTLHSLVRFNPSACNLCHFCWKEAETTEHLFFKCEFSAAVWFGSSLNLRPAVDGKSLLDRVHDWLAVGAGDKQKDNFLIRSVYAIMWAIWKARCSLVFQSKIFSVRGVLNSAAQEFAYWTPPSFPQIDTPRCSREPTISSDRHFLMMVDSAFKDGSLVSAALLLDVNRRPLAAWTKADSAQTPFEAELVAVNNGLQWASGLTGSVHVFSDAAQVVHALTSAAPIQWRYSALLQFGRSMLSKFSQISLAFVCREATIPVHSLASFSFKNQSFRCWQPQDLPSEVLYNLKSAMPHDVIVIDDDDDSAVMITSENSSNKKHKQVLLDAEDWPKDVKGFLVDDFAGYGTYHGSETGKAMETWGTTFEDFLLDYADDSEDLEASPINDVTVKQWSYKEFKQFDIVKDYSDHHFSTSTAKKPSKSWSKRIQHEWKILEADLPETIFVRVYEERMDLLRAVVIGPAGTPYHDGLFFFDCYFPSSYPNSPPLVHYHSGGLRLNPNLYACGKVCLSLLGTWGGHGCEKWSAGGSTMLQVLVSIQALVLNAKPYFNEPGFAATKNTTFGESQSFAYNEATFLLSCKTMLYSLRKPPKSFEDFVSGHFCLRGSTILVACRAYMDGAQVGCVDRDGVQDVDEGDKSSSMSFKLQLKGLFDELLTEFTFRGADCAEFLAQQVNTDLGISATSAAEMIPRLF